MTPPDIRPFLPWMAVALVAIGIGCAMLTQAGRDKLAEITLAFLKALADASNRGRVKLLDREARRETQKAGQTNLPY